MNLHNQDREIRVDVVPGHRLFVGEEIVTSLDGVEDSKGVSKDPGSFVVTTLRLLWTSNRNSRRNLSIGYHTIRAISIQRSESKLYSARESLCLSCRQRGSDGKFEFHFTVRGEMLSQAGSLFATVVGMHRAYSSSRVYREPRLRSFVITNGSLNLLPGENICEIVEGVWNLSSENGNLGVLHITNIRVVWHAVSDETLNCSLPYLQMKRIVTQASKYGTALAIHSVYEQRTMVLGFRIDPAEKLKRIADLILRLCEIYHEMPIFGVWFEVDPQSQVTEPSVRQFKTPQEDLAILEPSPEMGHFEVEDPTPGHDVSPPPPSAPSIVWSPELGLAIEMPAPEQPSVSQLWKNA
ncbi:COS41.4 [Polychytrium aggregatum]|uniref:COS41.4 n=1 Tax=Polychytrium aggregatum TaxID=110093 RepID=UPI0022FEB4B0|nr:COS41.4 [Polychytrium aggregatum]KAI9203869.1 COS41.4 [Polychytrium aggregatum]